MDYKNEGNYGGGFILGFLVGLIGLVIALCLDQSETKRGAVHGFIVSIVVSTILGLCYACTIYGLLDSGYFY